MSWTKRVSFVLIQETRSPSCREPPPPTLYSENLQPETHLPPQLLAFNANEHLNTAPSV